MSVDMYVCVYICMYVCVYVHTHFHKSYTLGPAARNHVNRMCQAASIPLIESGTAGYLGQVTVIKKVG